MTEGSPRVQTLFLQKVTESMKNIKDTENIDDDHVIDDEMFSP